MTFSMSTTEGFTQAQIDILNEARALLIERGILDRIQEDQLDYTISNAWRDQGTAEELAAAIDQKPA